MIFRRTVWCATDEAFTARYIDVYCRGTWRRYLARRVGQYAYATFAVASIESAQAADYWRAIRVDILARCRPASSQDASTQCVTSRRSENGAQ